jgi:hypothetical protein
MTLAPTFIQQRMLQQRRERRQLDMDIGRHMHWRTPIGRTSRPEPQANGPHLSRSGYSEKQCRPPCRSPRERRPEDQTTDAMDIEVPETRFRGRSQAFLYNTRGSAG